MAQESGRRVIKLPLAGTLNERPGDGYTNKDARLVNVVTEVVQDVVSNTTNVSVYKRPGLLENNAAASMPSVSTKVPRGVRFWSGEVVYCFGDSVYRQSTGAVLWTWTSTTTGRCGFAECKNGASSVLFVCDGIEAYIISSGYSVTKITDVDFPSPHVPTPVYLDGYVFLVSANTNKIFNCDLEAPLSWTALGFISAEVTEEPIKALARQRNQILAIKSRYTEFFYNAGNTSGSPLSRNDALVFQYGTTSYESLANGEDTTYWAGQSAAGGNFIVRVQNYTPSIISTDPLERYLPNSDLVGNLCRARGKLYYVLHIGAIATFVWDEEVREWIQWSTYNGTSVPPDISLSPFIGKFSTFRDQVIGGGTTINTQAIWQTSVAQTYTLESSKYEDDVAPATTHAIPIKIRTTFDDYGVMHKKQFYRVDLVGDTSIVSGNLVYLQYTNDDFITLSATRSMLLTNTRQYLHRLGSSRRRAWVLTQNYNGPFRAIYLEIEFENGET